MLRADRQSSEERVLLRALRDFNMGKLVADDVSIFVGMIDDLFPKEREHVVRCPASTYSYAYVYVNVYVYVHHMCIYMHMCICI
jgi:hypothetical protein